MICHWASGRLQRVFFSSFYTWTLLTLSQTLFLPFSFSPSPLWTRPSTPWPLSLIGLSLLRGHSLSHLSQESRISLIFGRISSELSVFVSGCVSDRGFRFESNHYLFTHFCTHSQVLGRFAVSLIFFGRRFHFLLREGSQISISYQTTFLIIRQSQWNVARVY